jgi:hypothetical protein
VPPLAMTRGDKCLKIQKQLAIHTSLTLDTFIANLAKQSIFPSHNPIRVIASTAKQSSLKHIYQSLNKNGSPRGLQPLAMTRGSECSKNN